MDLSHLGFTLIKRCPLKKQLLHLLTLHTKDLAFRKGFPNHLACFTFQIITVRSLLPTYKFVVPLISHTLSVSF